MNKIKRSAPTSPSKASGSSQALKPRTSSSRSNSTPAPIHQVPLENQMIPRNPVEQYWAARALTAEALLKARTEHHRELHAMSVTEDMKRTRERSGLIKANEDKLIRMERLTWALLGIIVFLALFISTRQREPQRQHWLLPSHFTIPVLSPFTSVVEHEASIIGARIIIASLLITACLVYFVYRHWIVNHPRKS
ncbi:hypothetical protein BDZ89DRAFT_673352 [Hymenopellis radicata]|nr:hypothetical protein BDZ89DRAFT_673352 [Hymenopellis radicata]